MRTEDDLRLALRSVMAEDDVAVDDGLAAVRGRVRRQRALGAAVLAAAVMAVALGVAQVVADRGEAELDVGPATPGTWTTALAGACEQTGLAVGAEGRQGEAFDWVVAFDAKTDAYQFISGAPGAAVCGAPNSTTPARLANKLSLDYARGPGLPRQHFGEPAAFGTASRKVAHVIVQFAGGQSVKVPVTPLRKGFPTNVYIVFSDDGVRVPPRPPSFATMVRSLDGKGNFLDTTGPPNPPYCAGAVTSQTAYPEDPLVQGTDRQAVINEALAHHFSPVAEDAQAAITQEGELRDPDGRMAVFAAVSVSSQGKVVGQFDVVREPASGVWTVSWYQACLSSTKPLQTRPLP